MEVEVRVEEEVIMEISSLWGREKAVGLRITCAEGRKTVGVVLSWTLKCHAYHLLYRLLRN